MRSKRPGRGNSGPTAEAFDSTGLGKFELVLVEARSLGCIGPAIASVACSWICIYLLSLITTASEGKVFFRGGIYNAANYANKGAYAYNRSDCETEQNSNENPLPRWEK
jgi:hypothetical protein